LLKINGKIVERPHMLMRVSVGIHLDDLKSVIETYDLMKKFFTLRQPYLMRVLQPQMSSCFLLAMQDDSIDGIYDTLKQTAKITISRRNWTFYSQRETTGSYIRGTNGTSNGIVPMLRVFNDTARYVDQGGGKRKGSFAIYIETWHADIFDFLDLKRILERRNACRDLFFAMWTSFIYETRSRSYWTLMCPNECPGL
jgi:ribonucleoside-diphosphate reductase alpha chain